MMVGDAWQNSSLWEPNRTESHDEFNSFGFVFGGNDTTEGGHHFGPSDNVIDESQVCLIDTACTSCMHSKAWREAFQKTLPDGVSCSLTPAKKIFHFANGQSTQDRLPVWRIPIYLDGFKGEVFSAEVPEGNTPLLLSIAAMTALDMVIRLKEQEVAVKKLGITMPLQRTRTRHLALNVAFNPKIGERDVGQIGQHGPRATSEQEDLLVYFVEEARFGLLQHQFLGSLDEPEFSNKVLSKQPNMDERGVKAEDKKHQVSERRCKELNEARKRIRVEDRRTWAALKREYTMAEQLATNDFKWTVLFEPRHDEGSFSRVWLDMLTAAGSFGWL